MVREVSGATKTEVPKYLWVPVTLAGSGAAIVDIGNHPAALINAATEFCKMEVRVPSQVATTPSVYIMVIGAANGEMRFTVDADWGTVNQLYNVHTYSGTRTSTATANQISYINITNQVGATLRSNDCLGVKVTYAAAGDSQIASNAYILGIYVEWA